MPNTETQILHFQTLGLNINLLGFFFPFHSDWRTWGKKEHLTFYNFIYLIYEFS